MKAIRYKTIKDNDGLPTLIAEKESEYKDCSFEKPELIVGMMNEVFQLDKQTEEYFYEACFTTKMGLIGVFEIAHGTIDYITVSPREVFQKALVCGASRIVLLHNHPSGSILPSDSDNITVGKMLDAGRLIGIPVVDNIIIGSGCRYLSYAEIGKIKSSNK